MLPSGIADHGIHNAATHRARHQAHFGGCRSDAVPCASAPPTISSPRPSCQSSALPQTQSPSPGDSCSPPPPGTPQPSECGHGIFMSHPQLPLSGIPGCGCHERHRYSEPLLPMFLRRASPSRSQTGNVKWQWDSFFFFGGGGPVFRRSKLPNMLDRLHPAHLQWRALTSRPESTPFLF